MNLKKNYYLLMNIFHHLKIRNIITFKNIKIFLKMIQIKKLENLWKSLHISAKNYLVAILVDKLQINLNKLNQIKINENFRKKY